MSSLSTFDWSARPDWQERAACRGMRTDLFYPQRHEGGPGPVYAPEAIEACRSCPVRAECLSWALEQPETMGMWGGVTPKHRRRVRGDRLRQARAAQ